MARKFDFGSVLNANTISQNTNHTLNIEFEKVVPYEQNFYSQENIDDLIKSIEECGILHNFVVVENQDGNYTLLSGHRRYNAVSKIREKDNTKFNTIPCKIEKIDEKLQQLYLISANKQRQKSDYEIMEEIKILKDVYGKLKSDGVKIDGKVRDVIAEEVGISSTQVQRFQAVEKKLSDEVKKEMKEKILSLADVTKVANIEKSEQLQAMENLAIEKFKEVANENLTEKELSQFFEDLKENDFSVYNSSAIVEKLKNVDKISKKKAKAVLKMLVTINKNINELMRLINEVDR